MVVSPDWLAAAPEAWPKKEEGTATSAQLFKETAFCFINCNGQFMTTRIGILLFHCRKRTVSHLQK